MTPYVIEERKFLLPSGVVFEQDGGPTHMTMTYMWDDVVGSRLDFH